MKKFLNYYAPSILFLFTIYNRLLPNVHIGGLAYRIFMVLFIIINTTLLVLHKKQIRYKFPIILLYFLLLPFSKDNLQLIANISTMITLIITGFMESTYIKVFSILITTLFVVFITPCLFMLIIILNTDIGTGDIYDDMHYYCENDYEIYGYSSGAMDSFHYSIGKHYNFLDIDDILYVSYRERNEVSEKDYADFLKNHDCRLVSDVDEPR